MNRRHKWNGAAEPRRMMRHMNACLRAARALQSYLDGEADQATARRVAAHLEECRRCGLEAATYREIKNALARREAPDTAAVDRLRDFGESLLHDTPADGTDGAPGPGTGT